MTHEIVPIVVPGIEARPLTAGSGVSAIVPRNMDEVMDLAGIVVASGMAPKDMKTREQIVVALLHGLELGLKPMQALQNVAVINGRPCLWGDAALAMVQASGLLADFSEAASGAGDDYGYTCRAIRVGRSTPITQRFTLADAKRAGLLGKAGPWSQYQRRMLQMRARAFCLRDGFADVLKGVRIAEEEHDISATPGVDRLRAKLDARHVEGEGVEPVGAPAPEDLAGQDGDVALNGDTIGATEPATSHPPGEALKPSQMDEPPDEAPRKPAPRKQATKHAFTETGMGDE